MRVLFIVQGEGRGHLTQAITMEALLRASGHEVAEVLVGKSNSRELPAFFTRGIKAPVSRFDSPNFLPTAANKRSSLPRSVAYNVTRLPAFARSVRRGVEHFWLQFQRSRRKTTVGFIFSSATRRWLLSVCHCVPKLQRSERDFRPPGPRRVCDCCGM